MAKWARDNLKLLSEEGLKRFVTFQKEPGRLNDYVELRKALLDFIADFANWDNSTVKEYLDTSRVLTQAAHEALGGAPGTKPLVVDPFAGGGSIPLEALRVGADAFASDLNPVAVLLNKVVLEYIPKYGKQLADEVRKWGKWIKEEAEKELSQFYPKGPDGSISIAYLWARTIKCEGPGCGAEVPLISSTTIANRKSGRIGFSFKSLPGTDEIGITLEDRTAANHQEGTCKGFVATCPRPECGYSTPKKSVQRQLTSQRGGTDTSRLLAILTDGPKGRRYRMPSKHDLEALESAKTILQRKMSSRFESLIAIPTEPIPSKTAHRAVGSQLPLYGFTSWGDLYNFRQKLAVTELQTGARNAYRQLAIDGDEQLARAVFLCLAFAVDKQADYSSSLCRWVSKGEFIAGTLAGEKKLPMISDFAEANPIGSGSGSWDNQIDWIARFIERESSHSSPSGMACLSSADELGLPTDGAEAMITDPPYYDSVPYADLSDYFYVWLKRTVQGIENLPECVLTPKEREMTVNHPNSPDEKARYEFLLAEAFAKGRDFTKPSGVAVIVFAHKSTSGWESILEAIIKSGWTVTASWPIDTERSARPNALRTASLGSSVHIICRPREHSNGKIISDEIGDWRDILQELPRRIHEWMPRLAGEGVVGADAIFACLGPALEVFSRYSRVEKASGEVVMLKEYLEQVWAAVAKEALNVIFAEADARGFEEDARLTAMWLWTLKTGDGNGEASQEDESDNADEGSTGKTKPLTGFSLEYDAARKIAQGLGAHLENLSHLVAIQGETAVLLPVAARTGYLFGKDSGEVPKAKVKKKSLQMAFDFVGDLREIEKETGDWTGELKGKRGRTVLDQVHQSMILFAAGRTEAVKRVLVEDGIGRNPLFWRLAQALSALYPSSTEEKRWVDGVLARKKGLGF